MRLTKNFTLRELTKTNQKFDNTPNDEEVQNLIKTAVQMEAVRALLGNNPVSVSSAFRSERVNKAVGGSSTSAHRTGEAVDFVCVGFGNTTQVCHAIANSSIPFDQLIWEQNASGARWVHIGFRHNGKPRRQVMTKRPGKPYVVGLPAL